MNFFWSVTLFWAAIAAALILALAFVLPFLMRNSKAEHGKAARRDINLAVYRDQMKDLHTELSNTQLSQEQFLDSKLELETRAVEDALAHEDRAAAPVASRRLGFVLAAALPVAAIALYSVLGNPGALTAVPGGGQNVKSEAAAQPTEADILQMIQRMEARAQANPTDTEVWEALTNANAMMGRWPEALQASEKSLALSPNKPAVMSAYAEALAMNSGMVLTGKPMEMVNKALRVDPDDRKGLELSGIHAFKNEQYDQAVMFLNRLQRLMPPDMPYAQEILKMRNEAQRLAERGVPSAVSSNTQGGAATLAAPQVPTQVNSQASVSGTVEVAKALQSRVDVKSTIYLIARDGESGPPVAVSRVAVGSFPLQFRLDDSMAMSSANTLSKHKQVVLLARISASGNPMAQSGDLEGRLVGVAVGTQNLKLVIDRVLP
jgi:cytochrome c-type biogenesis protein CcmH